MSHSTWSLIRWAVGIVGGLAGAFMVALAIRSLMGGSSTTRIECNRADGTCRLKFPMRTRTIKLADIRSAELRASEVSMGVGSRNAHEQGAVLVLADDVQYLGIASSDEATVAQYRTAVDQIQGFLTGTAPTLSITLEAVQSRSVAMRYLYDGVIALVVAGVVVFALRNR